MAQLPPKIPNTTPDSPELSIHRRHRHQRMSSLGHIHSNGNANANSKNPCWVDEFLDFSSVKRNAHRRSASDSGGAYLDQPPPMPPGGRAVPGGGDRKNGFVRFEDHLLSMFTDEISPAAVGPSSSSNPSTPSDHNDEKQLPENGAEEAHVGATISNSNDRIVDPKRVKRILANRRSAQRSRVKKLQYISELERNITSLQAEVSVLSPRVAFLDHHRLLLNVDNSALKQRIAALQQDKIFKDAHQEALKREIERLGQVYQRQNLNMENPTFDSKQPPNETDLMLNV